MTQKFIAAMTGYKATNADMTCKGHKFELGRWYEVPEVKMCEKGFHFCVHPSGVYSYYTSADVRVFRCEAEHILEVPTEAGADFKPVAKRIRLVEEVTPGSKTKSNTGDWNTGDWNTGDWNTGFFNTDTPKTVRVFGKEIDLEIWNNCDKPNFLYFDITYWVSESNMTDEDKKADPNFYVRGGQLRKKGYKEAFIESWNKTHEADRKKVFNLPGFNADIFFQISGIDVNQQQK